MGPAATCASLSFLHSRADRHEHEKAGEVSAGQSTCKGDVITASAGHPGEKRNRMGRKLGCYSGRLLIAELNFQTCCQPIRLHRQTTVSVFSPPC